MATAQTASAAKKHAPVEKESKIEGKKTNGEAKEAKAVKEKKPAQPRSKYQLDHIITTLVDYNPKRASSEAHRIFSHYEDGMTVGDFLKTVGKNAGIALSWDVDHGFVKVGPEHDEKVEKKSKPEAAPKAERKPRKAKAAKEKEPEPDEDEEPEEE
jgi:hypothetical protein